MDLIKEIVWNISGYIRLLSQTFDIMDVFDILIIAFLIYSVLNFMRRTRASSVIKGVLFLLLASGLSRILAMNAVNFLLRQALGMGLLVLAILFQPELRRLFEQLGTSRLTVLFGRKSRMENAEAVLQSVVSATKTMASSKTGGIIVFERDISLYDYAVTGTRIDAEVSPELITNIFFINSPLHDGALLIREGRILAAGCMLPLSNNINLGRDLGMRHRAGVGISERSDAVAVIISEQSGTISIAIDGMIKRHLTEETFEILLRSELLPESEAKTRTGRFRVKAP